MSREEERIEIETIENLVKQNPVFDNGKLIHGGRRNAIVFSRTGEIGICTDDIVGIKILDAKDIKSIKYQVVKDEDGTKEWFCILKTNDFDNPIIKLELAYCFGDNARDKYDQIAQLYSMLKDKANKKAS